MPLPSSPMIQAFNRWILTVMETLESKMDVGTPVETANRLTTAFGVQLTGDASASGSTDGSTTLNLGVTLAASGIAAGSYAVLTVDSKGRATAGRTLLAADVPTLNQSTTGNAATATKLATARSVSITGDGSWTVSLDGSANVSAGFTLANSGVTAGVYPKVTVDAKGRVTGGAALAASDIPALDTSKLTSGVIPTARGGTGGNYNMGSRNVTISTAGPSGGVDGDVWFQY